MGRKPTTSAEDWLRAGFRALVDTGPEALKAEPLARRVGATKGSFYWHFQDVPAFRAALLEHWEQRAYRDIVDFVEREPEPVKRLRLLGQIAASGAEDAYGGIAVEPAIRAWGRADKTVAACLARVDRQRLDYLQTLLQQLDLGNPDFARLIYAGLIGLEDLSSRDGEALQQPMETMIDLILALR